MIHHRSVRRRCGSAHPREAGRPAVYLAVILWAGALTVSACTSSPASSTRAAAHTEDPKVARGTTAPGAHLPEEGVEVFSRDWLEQHQNRLTTPL